MAKKTRQMAETEEEVLLRLLRGEDIEAVGHETGFHPHELTQWLEKYTKADREGLETRAGDPPDSEHPAATQPTWSPWIEPATWLPD